MTSPRPAPATLYGEDDLLPISALQHLLFCERQCALIHIEGLWAENRLTVEGRHLHAKAHEGPQEVRACVRITRGLALRSFRLGLVGVADVVEFRPTPDAAGDRPYPVEYKRGKPKAHEADRVQLCAQALCLEEMLQTTVPVGALFYGRTRRRVEVRFDERLRDLTEDTARRLRALIASGHTPTAVREPKCDSCSLLELCLPQAMGPSQSASSYLARALAETMTSIEREGDE
jgi:CRISPR-associated exonuclease Cas4